MDSRYEELLESSGGSILESYQVCVSGSQIFVSVNIANSLFRKE